jgi:glycosyltransferase involved in cell wall biosynthesis
MNILRIFRVRIKSLAVRVLLRFIRAVSDTGFLIKMKLFGASSYDTLRHQYSFYYNPVIKRLRNSFRAVTQNFPTYKIEIIDNSRVSVLWGNLYTQVPGRKCLASCRGPDQPLPDSMSGTTAVNSAGLTDPEALNILTMCTFAHGGAGTGSMRRIEALRNIGVNARLISLLSSDDREYIGRVIPALDALPVADQRYVWRYINSNIKNAINKGTGYCGQEFFSTTETVLRVEQIRELIDDADVIHLHWVVGMLDYADMANVLKDKPIVWTTADMNPFTGGCHYSEGCEGFMSDCTQCPMLDRHNDLPHRSWKLKKAAYDKLNITVVCPSEYIAELARKSSLFGEKSIEVIPNAYPVEVFRTVNREDALHKLGLSPNKKYVLYAAESLSNIRKGVDLFYRVAKKLKKRDKANNIEFICIGENEVRLPYTVHNLGKIAQEELSYVYSAADIFISLSREDVGPMTVVESLLCGTPVVGFDLGVLPQVVVDRHTGVIAKPFNIDQIVDGIEYVLQDSFADKNLASNCRDYALQYADPIISATRHKELYERLVNG